jgi:hypothetical protein
VSVAFKLGEKTAAGPVPSLVPLKMIVIDKSRSAMAVKSRFASNWDGTGVGWVVVLLKTQVTFDKFTLIAS